MRIVAAVLAHREISKAALATHKQNSYASNEGSKGLQGGVKLYTVLYSRGLSIGITVLQRTPYRGDLINSAPRVSTLG